MPEPKQFLVDNLDVYRKPILYEKDCSQAIDFQNLKHGTFYTLKFEKTQLADIEKTSALIRSVAYPDQVDLFKTSQERNCQMRNQVEAVFRDYMYISHPEDFMFYHSLNTVAHTRGHLENEKKYRLDTEAPQRSLKARAALFEATGQNVAAQIKERSAELRQKIADKFALWETEMQALLSDFDHYLEQLAEIEAFNSAKI